MAAEKQVQSGAHTVGTKSVADLKPPKNAATLTEYLVLKKLERPASNASGVSAGQPIPANSWIVVNLAKAASSSGAVRACVSKLAQSDQAGTFVAIPARSWKPVVVNPQTTIRLELTEAKP